MAALSECESVCRLLIDMEEQLKQTAEQPRPPPILSPMSSFGGGLTEPSVFQYVSQSPC